MDLILASTSRYRRTQLERLGVPFRSIAPEVDEEALRKEVRGGRATAEHLAICKALSLRERFPHAVVIGADQVVVFDEQILGKPGAIASCIDQLMLLSGNVHQIITAVAVYANGQTLRHTDVTTLRMRRLPRSAVERYVYLDQPIDCCGGYKLEQRGIGLFEAIESKDATAVTGLPLIALTTILLGLGFTIP